MAEPLFPKTMSPAANTYQSRSIKGRRDVWTELVFVPCTSKVHQKDIKTYRAVLALVGQTYSRLNQLALKVRVSKLLTVGSDSALRRVDWSLDWGDQAAQLFLNFRFTDVVEVGVSQRLFAGQSVGRVKLK